jgi:hypothetical protein
MGLHCGSGLALGSQCHGVTVRVSLSEQHSPPDSAKPPMITDDHLSLGLVTVGGRGRGTAVTRSVPAQRFGCHEPGHES